LLPLVEDTGWFFDTEMLVLAERAGMRIHEVPVDWVDDPDSSVDIARTATEDLRGVVRLLRAFATGALPLHELRGQFGRGAIDAPPTEVAGVPHGMTGQVARFAAIGVTSTLAYLLIYALLRDPLGAFGANLVGLVITAVANTAANRRLTFGVKGREGAAAHQVQGLVVFGLGLALTSGALLALHTWWPGAHQLAEMAVLVVANALSTVLRFVAFRAWIFRSHRSPDRRCRGPGSARRDDDPHAP